MTSLIYETEELMSTIIMSFSISMIVVVVMAILEGNNKEDEENDINK